MEVEMAAGHQHPHVHQFAGDDTRMKRILIVSLVLTLAFVVFEAAAGFSARSLALLSDAGHNFTDAFALLLAAFGIYLGAELRSRSKFKRRTPYDFYSSAGEQHASEFGVGI